jgi:hypothetical protein
MQATGHRLAIANGAVTDTLGNVPASDTVRFEGVSLPDTLQTRFAAFGPPRLEPDSVGRLPLLPDVAPTVAFNQGPDTATVREAVSMQDTLGNGRSISLSSRDGMTFQVRPDTALAPGQVTEVTVDGQALRGADTTYVQRYRRVTADELGELEGRVVLADTAVASMAAAPSREGPPDTLAADTRRADTLTADTRAADTLGTDRPPADTTDADAPDAGAPDADTTQAPDAPSDTLQPAPFVVVELRADQSPIPVAPDSLVTVPDSAFVFGELPEGSYRFRAFVDRNENGRWDPGSLAPYRPPEPITWSASPVDSRKRWTTVLPAPLRIVRLR